MATTPRHRPPIGCPNATDAKDAEPVISPDPPDQRRSFLKAAGLGVTGAALSTLLPTGPAAAAAPPAPFWRSLTDPDWHPPGLAPVKGDGRTDDTAAIQRVMDAVAAPDFGVAGAFLAVPPGEYVLTGTVVVRRFAGILQGTGVGHTPFTRTTAGLGSTFRWDGPADQPMIRVVDSKNVQFRDIRFEGNNERIPSAALNFDWRRGGREAQSHGTNSELVVEDCHFGVWPWTQAGAPSGRMRSGILFSGDNGNNDQFYLSRCSFTGQIGTQSWGIKIDNTQSVWGSITNCTFSSLTTGLETSSSTTLFNPQFNRCGTDFDVMSTAQVDVFGWQSEHSGRLASVGRYGGLRSIGGYCQIDGDYLAPGSPLIAAHPSQTATVSLTGMRFTWPVGKPARDGGQFPDGIEDLPNRPAIEFGPSEKDQAPATGPGFLIKIEDCTGLYADQCKLRGTMFATGPKSRGIVEWFSRHKNGIVQFRNELWNQTAGPGTRQTLNYDAWDPPRPGTHN